MDLNSRQYVVSLDMTRTGSIRESFEMRHNDDNELIIELRDTEGIIDLNTSGVINATLLVTRKDKVDIPLAGTITPEGRASFKLKRASLEKQGMVEVVAQFYFANDVRISTPTLIFNVLRDPSAGAVGDEGDDRTLIEIILNDAPALLEQLQTAYDELQIQKAAFADFQEESETAFSNAQNQRTTDFNADQAARNSAFEDAQTQRATDFNTSQGERTTLFNQAQTARQNDYTTWKDVKETELNQLASDTENSKLAADGATANANNAAVEALEAAEEASGAVAEVTGAKQSTVKNKTFANLDTRMEELEGDTYKPMQNLVTNGNFANGTSGWSAKSGTNFSVSGGVAQITATSQYGGIDNLPYINVLAGDIFYIAANVKSATAETRLTFQLTTSPFSTFGMVKHSGSNLFERLSAIATCRTAGAVVLRVEDWLASGWQQIQADDFVAINLTQAFGKGHEPTKEEMDSLLAKYPNSYFDGTVNLTPKLLDDLRYLISDLQIPLENLLKNGDFSNALNSWVSNGASSLSNVSGRAYNNGTNSTLIQFYQNHKASLLTDIFYARVKYELISGNFGVGFKGFGISNEVNVPGSSVFSKRGTGAIATNNNFILNISANSEVYIDDVILINLTQVFGAGNEPTKEQMDALLAMYPNSWFDGTVNLVENKRIIPFLLKRLELKADKAQELWITPTLLNGWNSVAEPGNPPRYRKTSFGTVQLIGRIANGTANTTSFQLPAGYRPLTARAFACPVRSSSVFSRVDVLSSGAVVVVINNGADQWVDLAGIEFAID